MREESNKIGAFNAKTHLSQLLEEVQNGNEITITKRGKPVARLIPFKERRENINMEEILKVFDAIRESIKEKIDVKSYIAEGRRY